MGGRETMVERQASRYIEKVPHLVIWQNWRTKTPSCGSLHTILPAYTNTNIPT
jgi:hypothetical protein